MLCLSVSQLRCPGLSELQAAANVEKETSGGIGIYRRGIVPRSVQMM